MNFFKNYYEGQRVLITGHTGFKGSWLALWLKELGAEVAGYSFDSPSSPSHFQLLGLEGKIRHYVGDVRDREKLAQTMDDFRPSFVFHLAAQALVRRSYADPITTFETNILGMLNLLECIRTRSSIEVAVLITSDKAYRNDEWCWGYRETDPLGGLDPYSGSKGCAELVAYSYFHSYLKTGSTRVATVRAGNVIGGGDWADDRIIPDCIRAWTRGQSVSIRSPQGTRPWQHVLEPLSGYLWLGTQLWKKTPDLNGEAFNFGPDASVNQTVSQLIEAMACRWPGVEWHVPEGFETEGHEAKLLKLSCDKALSYLNWKSVLHFSETVTFTVDWYYNWYTQKQGCYAYSVDQIKTYCQLARERGLSWTKP